MAKRSGSKTHFKPKAGGLTAGVPTKFHDRNLMGVNPLKQQFEPTESAPVRQHNKMAGGCD